MGRLVGGDYEEGEDDVGGEGGNGEDEEGVGADAGCFFPFLVDFLGGEVGVGGEVGIAVDLADVGGLVEEEAEPAEPVEKLGFADFADLGRQADNSAVCLAEEGNETGVFGCRRALESWITLLHVDARDGDCGQDGDGGDGAEDLHLGVAEPGDMSREVGVAGQVA